MAGTNSYSAVALTDSYLLAVLIHHRDLVVLLTYSLTSARVDF